MHNEQQRLIKTIQPLLKTVHQHPLFYSIKSLAHLQRFAEIHVFAVWDFMCLIKALQRKFICSDTLWLPPRDYLGCRLLHEIILEEESDQALDGSYVSHFEWYIAAMQQCGANTQAIDAFIHAVRQDQTLETLLNAIPIPLPAVAFMRTTFNLISQPVHVIASAFAYGREHITEKMFTPILTQVSQHPSAQEVDLFIAYFQRHIELDGGKHGELSQRLVVNLCGDDVQKWQEATQGAVVALESRLKLLDGIHDCMQNREDSYA